MKQSGFKDSFPIVLGYMPVAIAYGVLAKTAGISLTTCFLMSALVYAGASQFIALNMIILGISTGEIILTTFLVNIRHLLMSASVQQKIEKHPLLNPIYAFGVTDEFFSVASFTKNELKPKYILFLEFTPYITWVSFSIVGYLLGSILPEVLKSSMNIALYAMFIALIIPEIKKHHVILGLTVLSGLVNTICIYLLKIPGGWSIMISVILVSLVGMKHPKVKEAIDD